MERLRGVGPQEAAGYRQYFVRSSSSMFAGYICPSFVPLFFFVFFFFYILAANSSFILVATIHSQRPDLQLMQMHGLSGKLFRRSVPCFQSITTHSFSVNSPRNERNTSFIISLAPSFDSNPVLGINPLSIGPSRSRLVLAGSRTWENNTDDKSNFFFFWLCVCLG